MATERIAEVPDLGGSPTAQLVVRAAISRSTRRLSANLPGTRAGVEPEALHRARVAVRTLRSDLRLFGPLLDEGWAADLRAELQWFGQALGEVRDLDVLLQVVTGLVVDEPSVAEADGNRLIAHLVRSRAGHRKHLLEALDCERTTRLLDRLVQAGLDPPTTSEADGPAADVLRRLARRPWRHLRQAVRDLPRHPTQAELHRVRLLAKRCRYCADAVGPVAGSTAKRFARAMARIQGCLGEVNDAVTIGAKLRRAAESDPAVAYVAGQLSGILAERATRHRADFWPLWKAASRPRLRDWW